MKNLLIAAVLLVFANTATLGQEKTKSQSIGDDPRAIAEVVSILRKGFVTSIEDSRLEGKYIREILRAVDPDSGEYFTPNDLEVNRTSSKSLLDAFDLNFQKRGANLVVSPQPGGQAERVGLRFGDIPQEINGRSTLGMNSLEIQRLLLEFSEPTVALTVLRKATGEKITVSLAKQSYKSPRVIAQRPQAGILLLRVPYLVEETLEAIASEISKEWARESVTGVILDLRGNAGGLLTTAFGVATIFLERGTPIATLRSNWSVPNGLVFRAEESSYSKRHVRDPLEKLPSELKTILLVVLVDQGTSSGAEIIAAALRDSRRAILVGQPTGGNSSLQTIVPMQNGGAIRFTSAFWETPAGIQIDVEGLKPEVILENSTGSVGISSAIKVLTAMPKPY